MKPHWLEEHDERASVLEEIHARPIELIPCPARIRRVAFLLAEGQATLRRCQADLLAWCNAQGLEPPAPDARHHRFQILGRQVTWELHTEFVTLTWTDSLADTDNWPDGIGLEMLAPHQLIAAMRVDLIAASSVPDRITEGFALASLCLSSIEEGRAQVATDFALDAEGFTRFELAAASLAPARRATLVRWLLEIETYRTIALLGLPLARRSGTELAALETDLARLVETMSHDADLGDAQSALDTLNQLSLLASKLAERTSFRFAASRAYGDLLFRRLASLGEVRVASAMTLEHYLTNRIGPGLATCGAMDTRLAALAEKLDRATALLTARAGLETQKQTKSAMTSLAQTARSQLHLQRTVEGLSTIAIAYYALGILSYVLAGLGVAVHVDKAIALAAAAPLVLLGVWLFVARLRRGFGERV